jgi:hypothetical protein
MSHPCCPITHKLRNVRYNHPREHISVFPSDNNLFAGFTPEDGVILMTTDKRDADELAQDEAVQDEAAVRDDVIAKGELDTEEILERTVLYALEQGTEKLEQSGGFEPFTILIEGEELYIEEQPGETEEQSYAAARRAVYQMERLCNAYVFCYDGFVDLEDGTSDALVAEFARKGDEKAQIVVRLYHRHGDQLHFDEALYQVGEAETLFGAEANASVHAAATSEEDVEDADGVAGADDAVGADDAGTGKRGSKSDSVATLGVAVVAGTDAAMGAVAPAAFDNPLAEGVAAAGEVIVEGAKAVVSGIIDAAL